MKTMSLKFPSYISDSTLKNISHNTLSNKYCLERDSIMIARTIPLDFYLSYLQNYKECEAEMLDLQLEKYGLSFAKNVFLG